MTTHRPCSHRVRGGFTLVELLVVIAIIAILMALVVPGLDRARELARTTQCGSNTRNIALAMQMFAGDHEDALPWAWNSGEDYTKFGGVYGASNFATELYPYLNDIRVFTCPSFGGYFKPQLRTSAGASYVWGSHYRANPSIGYPRGYYGPGILYANQMAGSIGVSGWKTASVAWTHRPARLGRIRNTSQKVCIFDNKERTMPYTPTPGVGRRAFTNALGDGDRTKDGNYSPWWAKAAIGAWHRGRSNFAFFDGHTEVVPWTDDRSFGTASTSDQAEYDYWSLVH